MYLLLDDHSQILLLTICKIKIVHELATTSLCVLHEGQKISAEDKMGKRHKEMQRRMQ